MTNDVARRAEQPFWVRCRPNTWRERGLHWHAYEWAGHLTRFPPYARANLKRDCPPLVRADWVKKPAHMIRAVLWTPDDAVAWYQERWKAHDLWMGPDDLAGGENRFPLALYDLRSGHPVSVGTWRDFADTWWVELAVLPVGPSCPLHQRPPGS